MGFKTLLTGVALLGGMVTGTAMANPVSFKEIAKIPLPATPGHGDWVAYDSGAHAVYISLHGGGMAVVDTRTNKVTQDYKDIPDPNTMTFDKDYIYETAAQGPGAGKVNQIVVISKSDWKIVDRVDTVGTSPDGTFIDRANGRLYVVMDDDNSIDEYTTGAHPKYIKKIMLLPKNPKEGPDVANLYHGVIYATDDSYVEKVNPNTGVVENIVDYHLKLTDLGGTKGTFYDPVHNAIWVGTTTGGVLVINPDTLAVEKHIQETGAADAVVADHGLGLAYVFEGGIPGFDYYSIKNEKYLGTVKTGTNKPTHSGDIDPETHRIYAYAGGDAELDVFQPEE